VIDQASLERAAQRFQPPERSFERLVVRRARKHRNRRITTGVVAIIVALVSFAALIQAFRTVQRPADRTKDIFAAVQGWIAYGTNDGIWALNPQRPGNLRERLSDRPGQPVGWSGDGSKLLVMRAWSPNGTVADSMNYEPGLTFGLVVLHADGTETRVVVFDSDANPFVGGFSLSPDGSQVVFVKGAREPLDSEVIYVVDAEGGTPRLIRSTSMEPLVIPDLGWRGQLQWPAFSPDGTQIAYFHGGGDHSQDLKVMSADGTNARSLFGERRLDGHVQGLVWSPDSSELAFFTDTPDGIPGIWVIGADGSGYRRVVVRGENPSWSPDGSHLAFRRGGTLYTMTSDGSDLQGIGGVSPGWAIAWNPVE
jgi:Tol biopolymer transport system component